MAKKKKGAAAAAPNCSNARGQSRKPSKGTTDNGTNLTELEKAFFALSEKPMTRRMLFAEVGIYAPSVCRIVRALMRSGRCAVLKKDRCKVSGYLAEYLTCDLPPKEQLEINFIEL